MEPQAQAGSQRCGACESDNATSARFCFKCGASFSPPPACPACKTELGREARFCPACGLKVVGLRPVATQSAPFLSAAAAAPVRVSVEPPPVETSRDAAAEVKALTDSLPKAQPKGSSSNIVGNVLLFVAACLVFLVVTYAVNKDAPKEISPFQGGPAPGAMQKSANNEAKEAAPAANNGAPIFGTVKVAPDLSASAPAGTVFIIARMAGMPDRGPPIAVVKLDNPSFPASFEIGASNMMSPELGWSGPYDLYVRLDADGNAMTKAPGDLTVEKPVAKVTPGQKNIELVLDKRL
jgi:hypothetical protein